MRLAIPAALLIALAVPATAAESRSPVSTPPIRSLRRARGPIAVRAGAGFEAGSLEARTWTDAVAAALSRQGFTVVADAPRVARVSLDRVRVESDRARSTAGSAWASGSARAADTMAATGTAAGRVNLGIGLGFLLGGGPREVYATTLGVAIERQRGRPAHGKAAPKRPCARLRRRTIRASWPTKWP